MPYKWMLLVAAFMAATPTYLLWQGDDAAAAMLGISSFLICAVGFGLIRQLRA
jgi:uncharacterized membrane protein YjjP (DUF1212 family)